MIANPYRAGELVVIEGKGLFRVTMPLGGLTWLRSVAHRDGVMVPGPFDCFEWTSDLRRLTPGPLRAVGARP